MKKYTKTQIKAAFKKLGYSEFKGQDLSFFRGYKGEIIRTVSVNENGVHFFGTNDYLTSMDLVDFMELAA